MSDWYKRMFEGKMGEYWLSISDGREEATELQFSFLKDVLKKGLTLDLCCGQCRISLPLSAHMSVVGLDLSGFLLRTAKKRAKEASIENLHLVRGDMRYLPFKLEVFENVMNLWTSFGYFQPEEENEKVIKEISRVLRVDGTFILDMFNPGWLLRNFREKDWMESENYLSLEQRSVDWKSKRMQSRWIIVNKQDGRIDEISFDHRIYDLQELKELLSKEGLRTIEVYGSFRKEDFDEAKSGRIIIISRKT
jgi:ubiquinone/menaquinone biosynthesis C-methylase UbiE